MLDKSIALARSEKGKNENKIRAALDLLKNADGSTILTFLDRTDLLSRKEMTVFWQSEHCVIHGKALLADARGAERLMAYFSKDEHANADFVKTVAAINPDLLYRSARMASLYDSDMHVATLRFLSLSKHENLRLFWKELIYLNKLWKRWNDDERFYKGVLVNYSYTEILIHITSYYEKWKRSDMRTSNNKIINADMEVTLLNVINMMLTSKLLHKNEDNSELVTEPGIETSLQLLADTLPPLNPPEGVISGKYIPIEKIDDHKRLMRETIRFYFDFYRFIHHANMYAGGYLDFQLIDENEAELLTNPLWFEWRRNDFKIRQQKDLIHRTVIENTPVSEFPKTMGQVEREVAMGIKTDNENWKYLALCPLVLNKNKKEIEVSDCFKVLRTLSKLLKPPGRNIIHKDGVTTVSKQEFPETWLRFSEPSYLSIFEEHDLTKRLSHLLQWDENRVCDVLSILTTDLNDKSERAIVVERRPFIKIGTVVYWLSTFYADREWNMLMLANIQTSKDIWFKRVPNHNAEGKMESYFQNAGFAAKAEYPMKSGKDELAKPDVIAFEGNTLFLIEYKMSYNDGDVSKAGRQRVKVMEYSAKTQLAIAEAWLKTNLDHALGQELRKMLGIEIPVAEINIVPLIVTNDFDHDGLFIDRRIRVVTLYELSVILKNNLHYNLHFPFHRMGQIYDGEIFDATNEKEELFLSWLWFHSSINRNNQFVNGEVAKAIEETACDLWEGRDKCTSKRLIELIDDERVWQFQDKLFRYDDFSMAVMEPFSRQNSESLY